MFHCENCSKEYRWSGDYDLPEINMLPLVDRNNPGKCDCGGHIVSGFVLNGFVNIAPKGDFKVFYSLELGAIGNAQKEYKIKHPDAEFNKYGALKIKSSRHREQVLKEKGMVCLTDSREYREHSKSELDEAREKV